MEEVRMSKRVRHKREILLFFPPFPMTTLIERDIHHDHGADNSAGTMLVAVVAIAIVVGLLFFVLRMSPNAAPASGSTTPINVDVTQPITPAPANPAQ
jgi:hypothetical protein